MTKINYNSWPIGKIPKQLERPEMQQIKDMGYIWDDPRDIIDMFEKKVAEFSGSKYAVSVDCCSHAIFLSLKYLIYKGEINSGFTVLIPRRTYISVYMQIINAGLYVQFDDRQWSGAYQIVDTRVWDASVRWSEGMYIEDSLMCLSFQIKKRIPIGRGGMILIDSETAYDWLKLASYDGRDLHTAYTSEDHVRMPGYHMYMTPEDAARGIILMDYVKEQGDSGDWTKYTDLSEVVKKFNQ